MTGDSPLEAKVRLVSHEVRSAILVALARHQQESSPGEPLGFTELRRRVGHDDPGNFNYHLKKLVGNLVRKTDDGYLLSDVGHHYVALLVSGRLDPDVTREFPDAEPACPVCGEGATVEYEDGLLRTACPEEHTTQLNVGPELLDEWSVQETLNIALRRNLFEAKSVVEGVCPYCEGPTTGGFERLHDAIAPVQYEGRCERCGMLVQNTAGGCVLFHPAVVAFCYRHGIDIYDSAWEVLSTNIAAVRVREEQPLTVEVEIAIDDDRLTLTLDRWATVTAVEKSSTES